MNRRQTNQFLGGLIFAALVSIIGLIAVYNKIEHLEYKIDDVYHEVRKNSKID